jgi:hypothetical protein
MILLFFAQEGFFYLFYIFCYTFNEDMHYYQFTTPVFFFMQYLFSSLSMYFVDSLNDFLRLNIFKHKGNEDILNIVNLELNYLQRSPR